jgi:hypothetical protein
VAASQAVAKLTELLKTMRLKKKALETRERANEQCVGWR